jgi:hypothetical protein
MLTERNDSLEEDVLLAVDWTRLVQEVGGREGVFDLRLDAKELCDWECDRGRKEDDEDDERREEVDFRPARLSLEMRFVRAEGASSSSLRNN